MKKQGEILHNACKQANMTVSALAKRLGVTREYVYALFKKDFISSEIIATVTGFLPVQPAEFFTAVKPSNCTIVVFRGYVEADKMQDDPWDKVLQVYHFSTGR